MDELLEHSAISCKKHLKPKAGPTDVP